MVPNPRRLPLVSWLPVRSILAFLVVLSFILPAHALAQTAGVSSPSARIGAVLVADDFKNPERGLLPRASIEPDSYEQGYEAGYYVVRGVDDEWEGAVTLDLSGAYRDTRLSVDVKSIGERAGGIYLECRRGPTSGYGGVFFLDSGRYFIDRRDGSSWTPLTRNATSPYGRLRNTGFNLAMTCVGDRISLALDGMEIVSVRDRRYAEGGLKLGAETLRDEEPGSLEIRFGDLVANEASAVTESTTAAAATTPTAVPSSTPTVTPVALSDPEVASRVSPSVMRVYTERGMGSGVRVNEGVITNEHVVRGASEVQIELADGFTQRATVVRSDRTFDLALLSVDLDVPALDLEPVRQQRQGDHLLVVGYPGDLPGSSTLTQGALSAVRELDGVTYLQTDAAMTFGSSGGAIVNMRGKVIGITRGSLGLSGGINLGIAGESVRAFLDGAQLVPADNAEPDSAREQASVLVVGAGPQFHSLHIAGDVDWFSLSLAEGGAVAVFTDSDRCDTVLELYAPDGVTLLDEDDDGGRNLSSWIGLTAPETGVYYGRVSHASPSGVCQSYYLAARAL